MGAGEDKMISVIMSCHNSNQVYLKESIESILGQTYGDFELLVADNEVQFDLQAFLERFKDPRIKYIDNGGNIGPQASYDKLATLAKGEYVAIQDHDDIALPRRLELEKQTLDIKQGVESVSSAIHIFGGTREYDDGKHIDPTDLMGELIFWQPIKQPTWMKRKRFCEKYKYTPGWMIYDFEFWSRTREIPHWIIGEVLLKYRKSPSNSTAERARKIREDHWKVIKRNLESIGVKPTKELCQALDPFNHNKFSKEIIKEFEEHEGQLLKHIFQDLYDRKHAELKGKVG